MKEQLISCKACDAMIAKNANICPNCGVKIKKPIIRRWWFWGLALIFVFALILIFSNPDVSEGPENETDNTNVSERSVNSDTVSGSLKTLLHVGDVYTDGDLEIVYMSSGTYKEDNEFMQPKEGEKYIFLELAFKNISENKNIHVSFSNFNCYSDDFAAESYLGSEDTISSTISPGRVTSGYVYFSVPEDVKEIEIEYTPNVFLDDKVFFAFDGDKASDYQIEADTTASENACFIGSDVETSDVKISYLSWEEYISDNPLVQPAEGYWFISCEFLFENLGTSDYYASSFDFNCYADGVAMDRVYLRDNDLQATISAGRMAQGTVTFEVPMDASVVELEYVIDQWTTERIVFSVS